MAKKPMAQSREHDPGAMIAELQRKIASLETEHDAARTREAALAEVLTAISAMGADMAPVFETILDKALDLSRSSFGFLNRFDGEKFYFLAGRNVPPAVSEFWNNGHTPEPGTLGRRMVEGDDVVHLTDIRDDDTYRAGVPSRVVFADEAGARALLLVALRKDGRLVGALNIYRAEVRAFSEAEVSLVRSFAAQAVIAMENARLITEQREALEQQTAMVEVLGVINASPGDLTPVFDTILEKALELCDCAYGTVHTFDGEHFHTVGTRGTSPPMVEVLRQPQGITPGGAFAKIAGGELAVHIADITADDAYRSGMPLRRAFVDLDGARTALWVALRKENAVLGMIVVFRREVRPFTDRQINILKNFAAQAVIAMENARLLREQQEALERQTATAEVLAVINASQGDLTPVFDAILARAHRLCGATHGSLCLYDGTLFRSVASFGYPPRLMELVGKPFPGTRVRALIDGARYVHVPDITTIAEGETSDVLRGLMEIGHVRTMLQIPLRKEGILLGFISTNRTDVRPFSEHEISLLESFAAQAVIAMENARLLGDLRQRTGELQEALTYQTATADVLQVISRAAFDLQLVLNTLVETAARLCEADQGTVFRNDGGRRSFAASYGHAPEYVAAMRTLGAVHQNPALDAPMPGIRAERDRAIVHYHDAALVPGYLPIALQTSGTRTALGVPLLRGEEAIGSIVLTRRRVEPFTQRQIDLVRTFADQAVIAIENTRLLTETREALEQQRASAEILSVISTSVNDARPVFDKILESCRQLVGGDELNVVLVDEKGMLQLASYLGSVHDAMIATFPAPVDITPAGRAIRDRKLVHYRDIINDPDTPRVLQRIGKLAGYKAGVFAPMIWKDQGIGAIGIARARGAFSERELALIQSFADQAVIAIQNAHMFKETRDARLSAEATLADLRRTQDRLVQSEKMASLGQLTAGIAHEIKNPLNFVNNFSDLSADLLDELNEVLAPVEEGVDPNLRSEIEELTATLKGNLSKIAEHGRRADSIVKNMLEHSRTGASERRAVDLNVVAEEALNLAYHGARAEIPGFNITMEKDLDPAVGMVELYPQEFTRVLVNLINNGFYAARQRAEQGEAGFEPTLRLATRATGEQVDVRVRDNGTGIPAAVRDKIFEPFFTTKPAGEGTGLGLSLSYDIVVKQHGGQLGVESEPRVFTEFTITLPRRPAGTVLGEAKQV